jgi:hypothetical protein
MPNWCLNRLVVSHSDSSVLDRFVKAYNRGTVCNEFLPEPNDLDQNDGMGPNGWWTWRIENWGTKWDIGADEGTDREEWHGRKAQVVNNEVICSFDSAWAPPIGLYKELALLGFRVAASYFEPGMSFCGEWIDGTDNYIEYGNNKSLITKQIWEDYNLTEFFADDEVEA